ncbi:OmpA family protein [Yokenella regensburgei]|uniref:OmpA family protein n=1 Tax=Yokenella regensburgei TaxID=158877 RepID=UPI003ED9358E
MRKSVLLFVALHFLIGTAACLWLLWCFVPVSGPLKTLITLVGIAAVGIYAWKRYRHYRHQVEGGVSDLPHLDTQAPVVLVCGDSLEVLFQQAQMRKTAQGWWLRVGNISELASLVDDFVEQQPRQVGQLSVMYVCQPGQHEDNAVLRESLRALRHQMAQISKATGFTLPLSISAEFSGPETPWVLVRGNNAVVHPSGETPQALNDWQLSTENLATLPVMRQAFAFIRETLLDELLKADRLCPAINPFAVALRMGNRATLPHSVWPQWLWQRAGLHFTQRQPATLSTEHFPDPLLPLLAPYSAPVQGGKRTRYLILLLWLCTTAALLFSALNNRNLIHQVSADLQRWYAIPMNHYPPKAQALASLKQKVLLLERWQRQGEPYRYGLGYYPGPQLWLALQQAIDTWVPPPEAKAPPAPKIVRLDSMSLFDSGKAALKEGSTKVLVNALVGVKAKPGWLIVVSGHTDNTGSGALNQMLSLQRAEAVRNWMRDTGDVPESCFAVQGYGDSRPVATNDTPEGRTQNRRVEISLVPQANACRIPGVNLPSSLDGDGAQH